MIATKLFSLLVVKVTIQWIYKEVFPMPRYADIYVMFAFVICYPAMLLDLSLFINQLMLWKATHHHGYREVTLVIYPIHSRLSI